MKKTLKLIPAIAMLLISAVLVSTSTYAWFSMNRTVTATGMNVKATTSSSLVIATDVSSGVGTLTTVPMSSNQKELTPATHDTRSSGAAASGLVYNDNPEQVSAATGLKVGSTDLTFADVPVSDTSPYYIDYVVYIASAGEALANQKITASINPDTSITEANVANNAVSVDFYVGTTTSISSQPTVTYMDTLNLVGKDRTNNGNAKTECVIWSGSSSSKIPVNGSAGGYIKVVMRVYFDGGLLSNITSGSEQAYVYSNKVPTAGVSFGASFTASDIPSNP